VGLGSATAVVALLLGYAFITADAFEVTARQQLYQDPIVYAQHSRYQEIVLTEAVAFPGRPRDVRLYLNGDLQFSGPLAKTGRYEFNPMPPGVYTLTVTGTLNTSTNVVSGTWTYDDLVGTSDDNGTWTGQLCP